MSKKVCLVDGSGFIFRAFYGLPEMTSPQGIPIQAVYGCTKMFLELTEKIESDYFLVLFDARRANYRNEIFSEYKGTRKETPSALLPQLNIIRESLDAMNMSHLEMEGYEADDLIATYTQKSIDKGYDVTVVSCDKDLMQLIGPNVKYYDPMKYIYKTNDDSIKKFGVTTDKIIYVQALAGDSIDNIPGVPNIGFKTAAELVNEYNDLDGIYANLDKIKQNKRRMILTENKDKAYMSLQLVTLKKDVPVEKDIEEYVYKNYDKDIFLKFLNKYNFKSIKLKIES